MTEIFRQSICAFTFKNDKFIFFFTRTSAPKENIYYPAEPIEAECRVSGMPVPTVEWMHGSALKEVSFRETLNVN